jgi:hypothetical protein
MDPFLTEFSSTVFRATPPGSGWPKRFAIITACNEEGHQDADDANQSRTAELQQALQKAGIGHFHAIGSSPDMGHHEHGFGCEIQNLVDALELGRQFKQVAVFWIENDVLELVYDESRHRYKLGSWSARIKGPADAIEGTGHWPSSC